MTHERRPWWAMPLCETSRRTIREARQRAQQTGQNAELAEHAAMIRRLGKRVIEDIIHIGHRLTKAKDLVDHGGWEDWLREEFGWSADTALNFILCVSINFPNPEIFGICWGNACRGGGV
jgi:hypothetical protein